MFGGTRRPGERIRVRSNRAWIRGLADDPVYPGDVDAIDAVSEAVEKGKASRSEVNWFWWSGQTRLSRLAAKGDQFISLYRPRHKVFATRTVSVYPPSVIRQIFQERGQSAKTFHYVERGDSGRRKLIWSQFTVLARKAGVERLSVNSCREITTAS